MRGWRSGVLKLHRNRTPAIPPDACLESESKTMNRYATIKPLHKAILTLPDGKTVEVERIGRGRYTTAWANGSHVYLQTSEKDYSKEILDNLGHGGRTPYIPDCRRLGDFAGPYRLYSMPKYRKVTAKETPEAWRLLRRLEALREEAFTMARKREPRNLTGYAINDAFRELLDDTETGVGTLAPEDLPAGLITALRLLLDEASNYGEYTIEFRRANVAADAKGQLVLLDPLFDMAELRKDQDARLHKARRY